MMIKLTECRMDDGSSISPSSNQVIIPPKFQPTKGGARRRVERDDTTHRLRDENIDSEGEIEETSRGHLKRNITEEVRIIDSEFPEYLDIMGEYKFYDLGWMSEVPGNYYPTMVHEFYVNYLAVRQGLCKKGKILVGSGLTSTIPNRGDNTLAEYREVLVASLVLGFPLNMGAIITDEMMWRVMRLSLLVLFPWVITRVCREAHVPILAGTNVETYGTKWYELEKSKDESRYDLKLRNQFLRCSGPLVKLQGQRKHPLSPMEKPHE
ncbi:hypothetical protein HAX54_006791 [Datura stramonium]|uniref:Uncharacterized protein n=1 Tax=Datura stramonium TaxID=4076 RepID=A0ABS8WZ88_DATST|nr:hypothetical protein [Datura stramonium]